MSPDFSLMVSDQAAARLTILVSLAGDDFEVGDGVLLTSSRHQCSGRIASLQPAFSSPAAAESQERVMRPSRLVVLEVGIALTGSSRIMADGKACQVSVCHATREQEAIAGFAVRSSAFHGDLNKFSVLPGFAVWFTGFSGAGKTTIALALERELAARCRVEMLDADVVRTHICKGLGFTRADRTENLLRLAFVASLMVENGAVVLVSAISPYAAAREKARSMIPGFIEVYVNAPLSLCESRDVKGLYRKARVGQVQLLTGVDDPYEPPTTPDVECCTAIETPRQSVEKILARIRPMLAALAASEASGRRLATTGVRNAD